MRNVKKATFKRSAKHPVNPQDLPDYEAMEGRTVYFDASMGLSEGALVSLDTNLSISNMHYAYTDELFDIQDVK